MISLIIFFLLKKDDDEPGLLEDLKSQICDNIGLYAHKYEEEFSPFMQPFVQSGNIVISRVSYIFSLWYVISRIFFQCGIYY